MSPRHIKGDNEGNGMKYQPNREASWKEAYCSGDVMNNECHFSQP